MSRYSLPWTHANESVDTASKKSVASTKKSTAGFFYPPLTPPASSSTQAMTEPLVPPAPTVDAPLPPHPYQVAGLYDYQPSTPATTLNSFTHSHPSRFTNANGTVTSDGGGDKPAAVQNTYVIQHQHHHYHHHHPQPPPSPVPPLPDPQERSVASKLRPLILLLVFLPVPPLLSLIYLVIGHAILRRASSSSTPWSAPLLSSANAGATGGIILALPLFLLLFLILYPVPKTSPPREAHEDFFDDESRVGDGVSIGKSLAYATCVVLALAVGGAAGPLGVTCLGGDGKTPNMLTIDKAAIAGLVGGAVFWAAIAVLAGIGFVGRHFWDTGSAQKMER